MSTREGFYRIKYFWTKIDRKKEKQHTSKPIKSSLRILNMILSNVVRVMECVYVEHYYVPFVNIFKRFYKVPTKHHTTAHDNIRRGREFIIIFFFLNYTLYLLDIIMSEITGA